MADPAQNPAESGRSDRSPLRSQQVRALTPRAVLWSIAITFLVAAWTKQAELVTLTSQISESTPPIASILCLFLFPALAGLARRASTRLDRDGGDSRAVRLLRRLRLTHGEILVVFTFVAITAAMPGVGLFRQIMPSLMVPQYFGQPSDHLSEMAQRIPTMWAPTDPEVARVFWEGEDVSPPTFGAENVPVAGPVLKSVVTFFTGPLLVPWQYWFWPVVFWTSYISIYLLTGFCLVTLYQRSWECDEHLNFPVSNLPVELIEPESSRFSSLAFFRDPVVWVGLSVAVIYNGMNALQVFNPGIPALGIAYPLGDLFTEAPWDSMRGLRIYWKPELLGLGYLVPSDVLLSIWVFTLLSWFVRPLARVIGRTPKGFPFVKEQAMGAFIVLGAYFTVQARGRLVQIVRNWPRGADDDSDYAAYGQPWALAGFVLGALFVIAMPIAFGVDWWASLLYFGVMFVVLLVYARNRAEMGFPIVWGYPLYQPRASMIDFIGSAAFVGSGRMQSMTLLTMFSWLQRSVNQAIVSTQQEATIAAERLGYRRRTIASLVPGAVVFGVLVAFMVNLSAFYEYGGLMLSSSGISGGQMTREVLKQYTEVSGWVDNPQSPDLQAVGWTTGGGLLALGMVLARRAWPRFPFHAGGYALAFCHPSSFMWFPALLLWTIKKLALHIGGAGLYRRLARGFLALTLGHFLCVGVWSLLGLFAGEWVGRYVVWFL